MKKQQPDHKVQSDVVALVTTSVPEHFEEVKDKRKNKHLEYKPFGSDNLFPQALATIYRKSIPLRSIINSIVTFTVSGGLQVEETNTAAQDWLNEINNDGESGNDIFEKYLLDKKFSGNGWLQIVKDKDTNFVKIYHIQSTKCRLSKKGDECIIHPNWADYKKNDKLGEVLPIYPVFQGDSKGVQRSMMQVVDYEPDFEWYGIPPYIAAMDAAAIGYKTNKWNVSRLDNSFQSSGVLLIDGKISDDDAKALVKDVNANLIGEGNQGKILTIVKKLGGEGTDFTPINSNNEGDWTNLHNQSNDDLILALGWKKSLAGITESSGFDTDRIINDYEVLKSTAIIKEQNKFIKVLQKITKDVPGLELDDLVVNNVSPVSLLTKLTADKFTKKWEARKLAGLDYDSEDETQMGYIDQTTSKDESTVKAVTNNIQAMFKKFIK